MELACPYKAIRDSLYENGQTIQCSQAKLMDMTKERNDSIANVTNLDVRITELSDNEAWYITENEMFDAP